MNHSLIAKLAVIFFCAQLIGLLTAQNLIAHNVEVEFPNEDRQSVENSLWLIGNILVFTLFLLVMMRLFKGKHIFFLLKAFEVLAIFATSLLVFAVLGDIAAITLAVLLVTTRIVFSQNVFLRNVSSIVATAGAGALIGVSLGVLPVIVFVVLLAIYDYIAVFKTKHMVELAKNVTNKNLSFTFALPTKEHQFELGTGDIVVPLAFAASVLKEGQLLLSFPFYFVTPALIVLASFLGLVLTLEYLSKRIGMALPALPPQTVLMVLVYFIARFFGF